MFFYTLKKISHFNTYFLRRYTRFSSLNQLKGGGDVFRATVLLLCFKLPSCLFGNTRDTFVIHEKAIFVCFIYIKPQKVKFKFVQKKHETRLVLNGSNKMDLVQTCHS